MDCNRRILSLLMFCIAIFAILRGLDIAVPFLGRLNYWGCDGWTHYGLIINYNLAEAVSGRIASRVAAYLPFSAMLNLFNIVKIERLFFFLNIAVISVTVFAGLSYFIHRGAAAIASMLTMLGALTISVASTTYPSTPALAYGSIALLFACRAAFTASRTKYILCLFCGAFLGTAFNAHPVSLMAFFPISFLALGGDLKQPFRDALAIIIATLLGATIATLLIELVSTFVFQKVGITLFQLNAVAQYARASGEFGRWNYEGWWQQNGFLFFTTVLIMSSLISIFSFSFYQRLDKATNTYMVLTSGLVPFFLAIALTLLRGDYFLMYDNILVLFMLPLCLVVGATFHAILYRLFTTRQLESTHFFVIHLSCIAVLIISLLYLIWRIDLSFNWLMLTMIAITSFLVLCYSIINKSTIVYVVGLSLLLLGFQGVRASRFGAPFWAVALRDGVVLEKDYSAIFRAARFIGKEADGKFPNFWISENAPVALFMPVFRSFVRCGFEQSFPKALPNPKLHWQHDLAPGELLVVLAGSQDIIADGMKTMNAAGLAFQGRAARSFIGATETLRVDLVEIVTIRQ